MPRILATFDDEDDDVEGPKPWAAYTETAEAEKSPTATEAEMVEEIKEQKRASDASR